MATLENKTIVVIGGSSGIGFGVAKCSLLSLASHVIIASSTESKINNATQRLKDLVKDKSLPGTVSGYVLDARDGGLLKTFFSEVGEIDHLVWTSGTMPKMNERLADADVDSYKSILDLRFWGGIKAVQVAKLRAGGSITFTLGATLTRPRPGWPIISGMVGALDGLTRGLAVDLAPIRVNAVVAGLVDTEFFDGIPKERREAMMKHGKETSLVKHVATADEMAEAYLFLMECGYITGQSIEVDGGFKYV